MRSTPRTRTVTWTRPEQFPVGHTVFYAPRPIYGEVQWRDGNGAGFFYTAHSPEAPDYDTVLALNARQDAEILRYVSDDEAYELGRVALLTRNGWTAEHEAIVDDPSNRRWVIDNYLTRINEAY